MVSLRQLRYLDSLAETRHFGHAAEACAVSQPALSMQIKELEDELKVSLVERRKSGIELTEQGEEIARRARTILAAVRDLLDYAKHQEGVLAGVLKLGAIPSITPYLLPAALPELQRRFPGLSLQLRETVTATLVHELVAGDLDLVVVAPPIDDPDVETFHLFDDRFVLAMKASQANRRQSHASTEMLLDDRLLLLEEGHCLRDQALSYCRVVTPQARESFGASSPSRPSCRWWPTAMASHSCRRWPLPARSTPPTAFVSCPSARRNRGGRSASPGARPRRENGISSIRRVAAPSRAAAENAPRARCAVAQSRPGS